MGCKFLEPIKTVYMLSHKLLVVPSILDYQPAHAQSQGAVRPRMQLQMDIGHFPCGMGQPGIHNDDLGSPCLCRLNPPGQLVCAHISVAPPAQEGIAVGGVGTIVVPGHG